MDVIILIGSETDRPVMQKASEELESFGVPYKILATSAHRSPTRTIEVIKECEEGGVKVYIAVAGLAAHLAGVVAAHTAKPVIGVPMEVGPLNGLDALLSTVQMPGGVPVATMAIGKAGAKNAVLMALRILALSNEKLAEKYRQYMKDMAKKV